MEYAVRADGNPANVIVVTARETHDYPLTPGYFSARDALKSLVRKGLVDQHKPVEKDEDPETTHLHDLYSLAGVKAPSIFHFKHERCKGDLYVKLRKSGKLLRCTPQFPQKLYDSFPKDAKIHPDLIFQLEGCRQDFFLEMDMGNEKPSVLKRKVKKYLKLASFLSTPFVVVFVFRAAPGRSNWKNRAAMMLEQIIAPEKRGKQFVVAPHFKLADDILGNWLYTYYDPAHPLSLLDYK